MKTSNTTAAISNIAKILLECLLPCIEKKFLLILGAESAKQHTESAMIQNPIRVPTVFSLSKPDVRLSSPNAIAPPAAKEAK